MKKCFLMLCVLAIIIVMSGCNNIVEHMKYQDKTSAALKEIPKEELHYVDEIKYRIVQMDYLDDIQSEYDRYCPEFIKLEDGSDVLTVGKDKLKEFSVPLFMEDIEKQISFGKCHDYDSAIQAAVTAIRTYYKEEEQGYDCVIEEQPFYICYNQNANAWIISGTSDTAKSQTGGSVCLALEKDTGVFLMLYHTV